MRNLHSNTAQNKEQTGVRGAMVTARIAIKF